ncbi:hypothetical protein H5410_051067 [Solanum commersonii]|uniref:Uncharacterized protein n=1 Tax=Solanum commersonii TaxID=4109 RepID=A0A9J5WZU9_SOLCO|nr:hypothetical protein H5410_051067 [Solanum commersonii]
MTSAHLGLTNQPIPKSSYDHFNAIGSAITATTSIRLSLQWIFAPSPESNPNSPSPVTTIVGHYPIIKSL